MSKNAGKVFEDLVKQACEEQDVDYTRLKDAGFMYGEKSEHKRFTPKNICDCILFHEGVLLFAELKRRNKSLRFDEITQMKDLKKKWKPEKNVYSGVLCNLDDSVYFLTVDDLEYMQRQTDKKSFNVNDAHMFGTAVTMFVPPGKRSQRPDMVKLFGILYRKLACAA